MSSVTKEKEAAGIPGKPLPCLAERVGNCINHPGTTDRNRKTDSRTVGDGRGTASTEMKTLLNVLGKTHMGGWRGQGHNDSDLLSNMCLRVKSKSKKEGEIG